MSNIILIGYDLHTIEDCLRWYWEIKDRFEKYRKDKEEELRYARAFENGSIDEEQLKILLAELKKKTQSYEAQLHEIASVTYDDVIDDRTVEMLCEEAQKVLQSRTQLDKKKLIQDIIDKVTIFDY